MAGKVSLPCVCFFKEHQTELKLTRFVRFAYGNLITGMLIEGVGFC